MNPQNILQKHKGKYSLRICPNNDLQQSIEVTFNDVLIPDVEKAVGQLNEAIVKGVEDACDSACAEFQRVLGVSGDVAGVAFSGVAAKEKIRNCFLEYFQEEFRYLLE